MFKKAFSILLFLFIFIALFSFRSEGATSIESLVDNFMSLTNVQQDEYEVKVKGSIVYGSGKVNNVEEPSLFDEVKGYYKVTTELQETPRGNSYKIVFCFTDVNKVKNINKNSGISKSGELLEITNWGFWVSVWVLVD